jgi:tetratricopeptide (TPR) repeat protein
MGLRRLLFLPLVLGTCLAGAPSATRSLSVVDLLDRYGAGRFDEVAGELAGIASFDDLLKQLRRDGPAWIASGGPEARARRELTAATLALEAARAGQWQEWKWIQKQPKMCAGDECYQPPNILYWKAPPLLIEWGCELLRQHETPTSHEKWWQLAALAVAQRSEDPQFLVGDTRIGVGFSTGEIGNTGDEIKHLDHVVPRFPKEMRFVLAQGIARDRDWPGDATQAYRALENDPDIGGEAMMRLGAMQMGSRRGNYRSLADTPSHEVSPSGALDSFDRAEALTRDPYVIFLARYFKAQVYERQQRTQQAEAAYRGAVAAVPHAQSATLALATLIFRDGRRAEAQQLVGAMLAADPSPVDPWRAFIHADDRFWPQLIARLREAILE